MKASPNTTLTTRSRWLIFGGVAALLGFITLVVFDTIRRVPQVWLYIVLLDLHFQLSRLGLTVAGIMVALAVYIGIIRKGDVTPLFRSATYLVLGTIILEALIGLLMVSQGGRPGQDVHFIYGMASVLALPFFIFVEVTAKKRPAMGSYIWGFGLLAGILLRSIMTGA
jgi:hypothetical protein